MSRRLDPEMHEDDVDVTNLIDLLVVLCALLMLLMPAITSFREMNDLAASDGDGTVDQAQLSQASVLRFTADNRLTWNEEPIEMAALTGRRPAGDRRTVYLAGDPAAPYGFSIELRSRLKQNGWEVKELTRPSED